MENMPKYRATYRETDSGRIYTLDTIGSLKSAENGEEVDVVIGTQQITLDVFNNDFLRASDVLEKLKLMRDALTSAIPL